MTLTQTPTSVVVGIDGSQAAIHAAEWAIDEAISRDVPLRLVHITQLEETPSPRAHDFRLAAEYAETALRAAHAAVESTGKQVKIETAVLGGRPDTALIDESFEADMICVGSIGIGRFARILLGSTATMLAEKAHCPVAIIRSHQHKPRSSSDWIAVAVDGSPANDAVVTQAMHEAQLRSAPVLALGVWHWEFDETTDERLDCHIQQWLRRYPDVHVHPVAARCGAADYLALTNESVQLAILGANHAAHIADLIGPHSTSIFGSAECSVLVVR
jgi:nucleotide-binding universal stress UspA family protein